jgi:hypothetical protein
VEGLLGFSLAPLYPLSAKESMPDVVKVKVSLQHSLALLYFVVSSAGRLITCRFLHALFRIQATRGEGRSRGNRVEAA